MRDDDRENVAQNDGCRLRVPDEPDRFGACDDAGADRHMRRAEEIPAKRERIGGGDDGILDVDQEDDEVMREMIGKSDRDERPDELACGLRNRTRLA